MNRIERLRRAEELIDLVLDDVVNVGRALDQWPDVSGPDRGLLGSARWQLTCIANDADIRVRQPDDEKAQLKRLTDLGRNIRERLESPEIFAARWKWIGCLPALITVGITVILILVALGPIGPGNSHPKESFAMQTVRIINLLLYQYEMDHKGQYPPGKTSTEVFQTLIDEKYANDPELFYLAMPGKIRPTSEQLKAENVCFDVTGGVGPQSSDKLPLVFLTGYTVTYTAGAHAICDNLRARSLPGIAVSYKDNRSVFLQAEANGDILRFVPDDFDPGSGPYTQLRP